MSSFYLQFEHAPLPVSSDADEEIGGVLGMAKFIQHDEFKHMNVGFGLDEGLANPTEAFTVYNGERCPWCELHRILWSLFIDQSNSFYVISPH